MLDNIKKDKLTIIGSPISPYVRKVLVMLEHKQVPYHLVPYIPWLDPTETDISHLHPLKRIPILVDGDFSLPDSSVIVQYLEERFPEKTLLPNDLEDRARARWFEEYSDTKLFSTFVVNIFFEMMMKPNVLKQSVDQALIDQNFAVDVPECLTYLENQTPDDGFMFGDFSLADITLASPFRNTCLMPWNIDEAAFPKMAAYIKRIHQTPAFAKLAKLEAMLVTTSPLKTQAVVDEFYAA